MYTPARYIDNSFGFEDFFNGFAWPWLNNEAKAPKMSTDIQETDTGYELTMDIPGFNKDNVKAQLKNGYLTVTAEANKENEEKDKNGKFIRRERSFGSMSRSFYVGDKLKEEDIKAKFTDGTLKLSIPKETKEEIPQEKFIAIEG